MSQKAVIHTETRVIFGLTTDDNPQIGPNMSVVELASPITLGGGFWKLDESNNKVAATQEEVDASGVDEVRNRYFKALARQEYLDAIAVLLAEPAIPLKLKNVFQKYLDWMNLR